MKRLLALTWKEFLQLKRDRMTLRMIVLSRWTSRTWPSGSSMRP